MANNITVKLHTETYYDKVLKNAVVLVFSDIGGKKLESITVIKKHDSENSFSKTYTITELSEELFKEEL